MFKNLDLILFCVTGCNVAGGSFKRMVEGVDCGGSPLSILRVVSQNQLCVVSASLSGLCGVHGGVVFTAEAAEGRRDYAEKIPN